MARQERQARAARLGDTALAVAAHKSKDVLKKLNQQLDALNE